MCCNMYILSTKCEVNQLKHVRVIGKEIYIGRLRRKQEETIFEGAYLKSNMEQEVPYHEEVFAAKLVNFHSGTIEL